MKKYGKILNLKNVKADILDTDPFSIYFVISELPEALTSGKNGLSINGSDLLRAGSEVYVEVIDVLGNPVYVELANNNNIVSYSEGVSIVYSIFIYGDTPVGVGTIYLLGTNVAGKVVRWKKDIHINTSIQNRSKVRFYNNPTISVIPLINDTSTSNIQEITVVGSFIGTAIKPRAQTPLYYADYNTQSDYEYNITRTDDGNFTSDMNGRMISLNGNPYLILEVITNKSLRISTPIVKNNIIVNDAGEFSLTYFPYNTPQSSSIIENRKIGTAEILFRNLETFTGNVYRYKIYRSSINAPYDAECVSTGIFNSTELIYDTETPFRHNSELGKIHDQNFLDSHWFVNDSSSCSLVYSPTTMIDSFTTVGFDNISTKSNYIAVKSGTDATPEYIPYDPIEYRDRLSSVYNSNFIKLYKNVEYIFSVKVICNKKSTSNSKIEFYIKSTSDKITNNKLYDGYGLKLYTIIDNKSEYINYGTLTNSFQLEEDCVGTLFIYPVGANYTLSNISIKPYTDYSIGSDTFYTRIPFDARSKNEGNKLTCELFDIDNKLVIGNLSTIQYFDPLGISYPFNQLSNDSIASAKAIEKLNVDLLLLSSSVEQRIAAESSSAEQRFTRDEQKSATDSSSFSNRITESNVNIDYLRSDLLLFSGSVQDRITSQSFDVNKLDMDIQLLSGSFYDFSQSLSLDAASVSYNNSTYHTVESALNHLLYVPITLTSFNGGGVYETGSLVTSLSLSWTYNTVPISQTLTGESILLTDRSFSSNVLSVRSNRTWTLYYSDGTTSGNSSKSISFSPKRYWGTSTTETLSDANIMSLSSEFSTSRSQTRTFDCTGGKYFYIVYPASAGAATFTINGLLNNAFLLTTRNFTNSSGYTQSYNIYRSLSIQYGSTINVLVS